MTRTSYLCYETTVEGRHVIPPPKLALHVKKLARVVLDRRGGTPIDLRDLAAKNWDRLFSEFGTVF